MSERTIGTSPHLRLLAWGHSRFGRPFKWGETNCLMLCLEAIDVMKGTSLASEWKVSCSNIRDVVRNTRRIDHEVELMKAGFKLVDDEARVGDLLIGLPPQYRQFTGHVVLGKYCISSYPKQGVVFLWLKDVITAPSISHWRMA